MEYTQSFDKTYPQYGNYQIKGEVKIDADTQKIISISCNQIIRDEVMVFGTLSYSDFRISLECQFENDSDRMLLFKAVEQYIQDIENEVAMTYSINVQTIAAIQKNATLRLTELKAVKAATQKEITQVKSELL